MSHEWIRRNIVAAVGAGIAPDILKKLPADEKNYARHLFYAPAWHPSDSPRKHMEARHAGNAPAHAHVAHDAYHYNEAAVKAAVNARKAKLRRKFGALSGLQGEQ